MHQLRFTFAESGSGARAASMRALRVERLWVILRISLSTSLLASLLALRKALAANDARETLTKFGLTPASSSPAEFARFIDSEITRWDKAIAASGAKVD